MPIVLCRIDNRLIHGQVAIEWMSSVNASLIVVANNRVADDEFAQELMDLAAPSFCKTKYLSIDKTIEEIQQENKDERIAIICETPKDALSLVEGGLEITKINIGNMHMSEGKRQVATVLCVDDDDVEVFKTLKDKKIELEIRRIPSESIESLNKIFNM